MAGSKTKQQNPERKRRALAKGFELLVIVPTLAAVGVLLFTQRSPLGRELLLWVLAVATVELLPVPFWRGLQMSMGFPVLLATGFLYPPAVAALIALLGSFDPREFKREVTISKAMFNRTQVALCVLLASSVFHALASIKSSVPLVLFAATAATVVDYVANSAIVTVWVSLFHGLPPRQVIRQLRIGRPSEFLLSYLGLGLLAIVLAQLYEQVGFWSVAALLAPLVFARQMFFRSRALEEAHRELKVREQVLQALSDRMAEERQDERAQIAAYLHDDLAQLLFRLSLQVDLAKRHLRTGEVDATEKDLESIRQTKNKTSELVRALIRDLHRSPLGRAGLAEALASFTGDLAQGSDLRFHTDIAPVGLSPAFQLIVYHIAREAAMNAFKHASAENVWIALQQEEEFVELTVRDDGAGFDPDASLSEEHFGLSMMRERAHVAGGTFKVSSVLGEGSTITVQLPTAWLKEGDEEPGGDKQDPIVPVAEPAPSRGTSTSGPSREVISA